MSESDPPVEDAPSEAAGWHALVAKGKRRVSAEQARSARLLEKHKDRPLVDVALRFYRRDRESAGTVVGSAVAFRLFLFFVPLLLFLVGLLGFAANWVDSNDVSEGTGITGSLASQINTALTQPNSTRWIAVGVGLLGIVTAGRALSKVLVSASCLAWRLPMQTKASPKVVGAIMGLIVGIGLISIVVNRVRAELGVGVASLSFLAAFAFYIVAWMILHAMLPRATKDPGALLPGAVLMGATLAALQAISQLYLPNRFGRASELYGAIGTTVVTLGWFFFIGRAFVAALALDAVIHERFGSISRFVFALPLLRLIPRHSGLIRRIFDLD